MSCPLASDASRRPGCRADACFSFARCQQPVQQAEQVVSQALQIFTVRAVVLAVLAASLHIVELLSWLQAPLQRCAARCQDTANAQLPVKPSEKDISAAQVQIRCSRASVHEARHS